MTILDGSAITGQARLDSHLVENVGVATALVNAFTCQAQYGKPTATPRSDTERRAAAAAALPAADPKGGGVSRAYAADLAGLAAQLRQIFQALAVGSLDAAARLVNDGLHDYQARPHLDRQGQQPWRLHFHASASDPTHAWGASTITGLAVVIGAAQARRLGTCHAPSCDRVYFDLTRNGSRRFCSTICQDRVKSRAYRNRNNKNLRFVPPKRAL